MVLVCVHVAVAGRQVIPWTISSMDQGISFVQLFEKLKSGSIDLFQEYARNLQNCELKQCSVSKAKEAPFSIVGTDLPVDEVSVQFGSYVKLYCESQPQQSTSRPVSNAFDVLMTSQAALSQQDRLPQRIDARNKKDKLFDDLIGLFEDKEWSWATGGNTHGKQFLLNLRDVLWYVDGHHAAFENRSFPIPELFKAFAGYNVPEHSKHRKRKVGNMSYDVLISYTGILKESLLTSWMQQKRWHGLRESIDELATSMDDYSTYLRHQTKSVKRKHDSTSIGDAGTVKVLPQNASVSGRLQPLFTALQEKPVYYKVTVNDFAPIDPKLKYQYVRDLETGLPVPTVLYTCSLGSNLANYHYIWKIPEGVTLESATNENLQIIDQIREEVPTYHTRALRREFLKRCGRIAAGVKSHVLRQIYRELTGDASAGRNADENEIDKRVAEAIEMEDPDILLDLRRQNVNGSDNYSVFWTHCKQFLDDCTAVQERRHDSVCTYMAKAISVCDLIEQVSKMCPDGTPIPSAQWVRLQFHPKNPRTKAAAQFRKQIPVKMMIQQRQFRHSHVDAHYCAPLFRYLKEYALKLRDRSLMICLDDKHRVKVGEPGLPVASVERGKKVLVALNQSFEVCDHDFTRFSLIPSVTLLVDMPDTIDGSWYSGEVFMGLKDAVFEPSSSLRHITELHDNILLTRMGDKSVLFLYTDGGPDHRCTYVSVQLSLITLFLNLNLDLLCSARTAPNHSWRNPVERIMSIINLGFQSVGLMRGQMSDEAERAFKHCNSIAQLRSVGEPYRDDVQKSLEPTITLLSSIVERLQLKEKKFTVFSSSSDDDIQNFWEVLQTVDSTLNRDNTTKKDIKDKVDLKAFFDHCCQARHYSFSIKKCGKDDCRICKPPRMPMEEFQSLCHLRDPMMGKDDHYLSFEDVFAMNTSEKDRPSLSHSKKAKSLPFTPSNRHVQNVGIMVQCEECDLWRLLYSKRKLTLPQKQQLQLILDDVSYSCGALFQELDLSENLSCVHVLDHSCYDPIEPLYYTAGFEPICVYCASADDLRDSPTTDFCPMCDTCITNNLEPIKKL